jgi:Fe-S oxidoreductase
MKTKGEISDADYPAQITAALASGIVASVLRGVKTLEELKAWTAAANSAQTGWLRTENGTQLAQGYHGCTMCGRCERACPKGIPTADVVRCVRYYHGAEHDPALAARQFAEMGLASTLTKCDGCGLCEASCPQKIGVRAELRRSSDYLTAGVWS